MSPEILDHLTSYVRKRFQVGDDDAEFGPDVHLFEEGYVDSAGFVELVSEIERTYGIQVPDELLTSEEFTTLRRIAEAVLGVRTPGSLAEVREPGSKAA